MDLDFIRDLLKEVELLDTPSFTKNNKFGVKVGKRSSLSPTGTSEKLPHGHTLHHSKDDFGEEVYTVQNKSGLKTHEIRTEPAKDVPGLEGFHPSFKHVTTVVSSGTSPLKAHDIYHHIMKHHGVSFVGTEQTEGGRRVWQKLGKMPGVSVHGWKDGQPVNTDAEDENAYTSTAHRQGYDPNFDGVAEMPLIASYLAKRRK